MNKWWFSIDVVLVIYAVLSAFGTHNAWHQAAWLILAVLMVESAFTEISKHLDKRPKV